MVFMVGISGALLVIGKWHVDIPLVCGGISPMKNVKTGMPVAGWGRRGTCCSRTQVTTTLDDVHMLIDSSDGENGTPCSVVCELSGSAGDTSA